jgi:four helix bundle protein
MNSHADLRVWQESMNLVEDIYRLTLLFPKDELFGLTSQIRRSVVSIPSNIAEGGVGVEKKNGQDFCILLWVR